MELGFTRVTLLGSMLVSLAGCEDCKEGNEGCACFENQTCNGALACRSETCVNLSASSSDEDDDGAEGNGANLDACMSCAEETCSDEVSQCEGSDGCEDFVGCMIECSTDVSCQTDCAMSAPQQAQVDAVLLTACAYAACPEECVGTSPDVPTPGGPGTASGPELTPGLMPGDPVSVGPTPDPAGPDPAGPDPSVPEPTLIEGTNWLVLTEEAAPATEAPNSLLGVNGVFYAYDDGCATYTWDPVSRCVSGTHCTPSAENWGVGIGFDFYNDGTQKTTWSAPAYAARGIAWSANSLSTFQVWLTNMDPSYGTMCPAASDCGIAGPPDGYSSASYSGTMYFDNLSKDDWGGTGVVYTFDATRILSIQFKLPASSANPDFDLCIGQLGIIL